MGNQADKGTLDSWKEIAAYLKRTEKTCRRWEIELGLPIHRLENSSRARVFAYKDEIDAWVEKDGNHGFLRDTPKIRAPRANFSKIRMILGTAAFGAILVFLALWLWVNEKESGFFSSGPVRSIAILPIEDLSPEKDQEHLADGMTDALINALCSVPGLQVPARTSSFLFKGTRTPLSEIGRILGADALIEGSIQLDGGTMRLTVQLVKASDGYHLWSEKYDRPVDDIFSAQDEIAREVVQALQTKFLRK